MTTFVAPESGEVDVTLSDPPVVEPTPTIKPVDVIERLTPKDVLIVRGLGDRTDTIEGDGEFCQKLARHTGCLVVSLDGEMTIETLDEDEMHGHGWVKATE